VIANRPSEPFGGSEPRGGFGGRLASRAISIASRRSVFTRSPGFFGITDSATTRQSKPGAGALVALRDAHGDTWWDTKVPPAIRKKVEDRKKQERKNKWHQLRSRSNINYADFGDMPGVILNNWTDFEDRFDSQEWVKSRFDEMEKSRNVIAHNNVLEDTEIERIRLYLQDWARIVGL
jgi:hypothetical protein